MNVTSRLERVTIYREGAVCTRRASLASVASAVRVTELPMSLVPGSVRARVISGPIGVRVMDVRPGFDVAFGDAVDESTEVKNRDAARNQVASLEAHFNRLDTELRELQGLKPAVHEPRRGEPPRPAPVEAALSLGAFVDERMQRLLVDKRKVERELRDAREALQLAERRLAEASSQKRTEKARVSRAVVISLSSTHSEPMELELEYQVPGVRWVPGYALRLEPGFQGGTLRLRASVAQDTGEDWRGVALSLSTAMLLRRTDVPELKSLRVGRAQPAPPKPGFREPPPGLDELFEGYDSSLRPVRPAALPPAPPPPPAPMPKPAPEKAKKLAPRDEEDDEAMLDEGAAMPRRRAAMAPGAPPAMARAPSAMPMQAKARGGLERAMATGGGGLGSAADEFAPEAEVNAPPELDEEPITGSGLMQHLLSPTFTPAESLLDYDRLTMPGADAGNARGRLARANEFDFAFAVGVSVQVDVVVALLASWQQRAGKVLQLGLPPRCTMVASFDSFDFRYDCAGPVDVPSTGTWSTVPVMDCQVALTPQYVCVPALEPKVFRTLTIANATTRALLPGPVDVSVGDEFLITTSLPAIAPGSQNARLGLGVEEAIKVSRKTNFAETTGGFLGGSTVLKHDVEIELNNRLSTPAAIEIRERVPQAPVAEKDIKVEEAEVKPPWERAEGPVDGVVTQGLRRWRLTLPPGTRQTLSAQVLIRIPADKMLVGGNRRA